MSEILIENTSAQLHGIGQSNPAGAAGALVQPNLVTLKPGLNRVDAEAWKRAKTHRMVQLHITEGTFRELTEVDSLSKLSPSEAQKYIAITLDSKLLLEWKGLDKRQKVVQAIEARLEKLDEPEPGTVKPDGKGGRRE